MGQNTYAVSVVIEWYNMSHAELDRATRLIAALKLQAESLFEDHSKRQLLSPPLDLVIVFNNEEIDEPQIRKAVDTEKSSYLWLRFLGVAGGEYCELKNRGAEIASGDIIIFVDCDVIPESDWLSAFLEAFAGPDVQVAVGNTYVDWSGGDLYSKAMALTWMFPLRDMTREITVSSRFYANNAAFRRNIFLPRKFPKFPA